MSSRLADLRRARHDAPSQGYTGERTKWSGARDTAPTPVDTAVSSGARGYGSSSSSSPSQQQALASGLDHHAAPSHGRHDAGSHFADRYGAQRSYSGDSHGGAHAAAPKHEPRQPQRQGSWASSWFGGGKTDEPEEDEDAQRRGDAKTHGRSNSATRPSTTQRAATAPVGARTGSGSGGAVAYRPPAQPGKPRYIPPSERAPGGPAWEGVATHEQQDESWGAWASRQRNAAGEMWQSAGETVSAKWNDREQTASNAASAVGTGAAKVAGGAVKYTAKGVWAVGKAAFK